jgi:hypothetical protein
MNKRATRKEVDELIGTSICNVMASVESRGAATADVEELAQRTADKVSSLRSELARVNRSMEAMRDEARHAVKRTEVVQALQGKVDRADVEAALQQKVCFGWTHAVVCKFAEYECTLHGLQCFFTDVELVYPEVAQPCAIADAERPVVTSLTARAARSFTRNKAPESCLNMIHHCSAIILYRTC